MDDGLQLIVSMFIDSNTKFKIKDQIIILQSSSPITQNEKPVHMKRKIVHNTMA